MANLIPRTWNPCENEVILSYYNEICDRAKSIGLALEVVPKLFIFKSSRRWGECRIGTAHTVIGINEVFTENPDKAVNTLIHELAHAITELEGHTDRWRQIANKIGEPYGEKVSRCMSEDQKGVNISKPEPKYILECPICHHQWKYTRMQDCIKYPYLYRCLCCGQSPNRIK